MSHDPLRPHSHDPNPEPPPGDAAISLHLPGGALRRVTVGALRALPHTAVAECYIVSTGHGTSGPFTFGGTRLLDLIEAHVSGPWHSVEVVSGDGFGNRVLAAELHEPTARPMLLAYQRDGAPLTREEGLVRLVVPSERDDALRQVKWVAVIRVRGEDGPVAPAGMTGPTTD